jgi:uncharacterized membrane protein
VAVVPDRLAPAARVAHDAGLATWVGGSMFGKFALNKAVAHASDPAERGKVVNAAWGAYNAVNAVAFAGIAGGWLAARASEARPGLLSPREQKLAKAKDALMVSTLVTSLVTGVQGIRLARAAEGGAVPIESGTRPAAETPPQAARLMRSIGVLANLDIALGYALVAVNAALAQEGHSRPVLRRALLRRAR